MVKFSCFSGYSLKPKKSTRPHAGSMHKVAEEHPQVQALVNPSNSKRVNSSFLRTGDTKNDNAARPACSISIEKSKSEEIKCEVCPGGETMLNEAKHLQKSHSLGSELYLEGRGHVENDVDDCTDQEFPSQSHEKNGVVVIDRTVHAREGIPSHYEHACESESVQASSEQVDNELISSAGESHHSENGSHQYEYPQLFTEHSDDSSNHSPQTPPVIFKSSSTPSFLGPQLTSGGISPVKDEASTARSFDLHVLDMWRTGNSDHEDDMKALKENEVDDTIPQSENSKFEIFVDDGCDSYDYLASPKDWIVPGTDELNTVKIILQGESSGQTSSEFPSKDFKVKRIEEWVNDLNHCNPLEEAALLNCNDEGKRESIVVSGTTSNKVDMKLSLGMETAKKYISSLSPSASTVQLSNHGLVVIPFLSAFVSMRVLNLSGNAIVRITSGSLPRGLHTLNLTKNNISTIEGLRELTRLRVLDLSYNRIIRIGHGLASCSSLKELNLAGNKISEVDGLHRLLKLSVLDLRSNKISTAKCLGQLASNYNSLQAVSLEGNPAQKNVGDEQLKKYLQGLLPHMVYFNRQPIKTSTLKDAAERSVRLGVSAHSNERGGARPDLKPTKKSIHGNHSHRPTSSLATTGHKSPAAAVASPKNLRGKHGRLPQTGIRSKTDHHPNHLDFNSKLLNFRSELSMHRVRSAGALGAH